MASYNLQGSLPVLERSLAFFRPHHLELRRRLTKIFLSLIACTVVAYIFVEKIAALFIAPLFAASPLVYRLVYTHLPEAFVAYLKLAFLVGLIFSMPVTLFQLWRFVSPGLKKSEKKFTMTVVFAATILFIGGGCFAFFIVMPKMLIYFLSYANENLEPLPKLGLYLTFVARTILSFGLAFQIPFLMVMAGKSNLVASQYFKKNRTYFYIAIIVLAFLLTAGDFTATALLSIPLFFLYEAGILLARIFTKKQTP